MPNIPATPQHQIQELTYYRLYQLIGDPERGIPPLIPMGRTTFLNRCADGTFPKPVKFGRSVFWKASDVKIIQAKIQGGN